MKRLGLILMSSILFISFFIVVPRTAEARDPIKPSCNFTTNQVTQIITGQVSSTPSFAWGIQLTATGANTFGTPVAVQATFATVTKPSLEVRNISPGGIYGLHTGNQYDIFHGSLSNYNYSGSSTNAALASGDIIHFVFSIDGPNLINGTVDMECKIP